MVRVSAVSFVPNRTQPCIFLKPSVSVVLPQVFTYGVIQLSADVAILEHHLPLAARMTTHWI